MKNKRSYLVSRRSVFILALFFLPLFAGFSETKDERSIAGTWVGEITVAGKTHPIIFEIEAQPENRLSAVMRYPSESDVAIPVDAVTLDRRKVTLTIRGAAQGVYEGRLSTSKSIRGDWTSRGHSIPLNLKREEEGFVPNRPQTPKGPVPYEAVEVRIPNKLGKNDQQLAGI